MATRAYLDTLPLDESAEPGIRWPLYRGTEARPVMLYGFGPRWAEYKNFISGLKGKSTTLKMRGIKTGGGNIDVSIPDVHVLRATRVNEVLVEIECCDSRVLLMESVGDMDFNMRFGGGYLPETSKDESTPHDYKSAIEAYCKRIEAIRTRLGSGAFDGIPERKLESQVYLSAMVSADPLGYLCDRAGCDLVVGVDGKWYFASREDASAQWFQGLADYNWQTLPGFLNLENITLRRPQVVVSYYWEHHTIRAEGVNADSTVAGYGPAATRVYLQQVYLDVDGVYRTLEDSTDEDGTTRTGLLNAHGLNGLATDATIAKAILTESAQGCSLHPLGSHERKTVWGIIKRDWRRLWRIRFSDGNRGGWDNWRFGKIQEDGSVEPVSVECKWVRFSRVVSSDLQGSFENRPWTFNEEAPSPFVATWDNGPESGVIRLVVNDGPERMKDAIPPMPGELFIQRGAGDSRRTDALCIVAKPQGMDNGEGQKAAINHLLVYGREDLSRGQIQNSFQIFIYLTARRFMPNDKTRWHKEEKPAFGDGDIQSVELPPSGEVECYRTYRGGDHDDAVSPPSDGGSWAESDGLGRVLNKTELSNDSERRTEISKITHCAAVTGEGRADTLALALRPRIVNGPVQELSLSVVGVETFCEMRVGNLADDKSRAATAMKRIANRKLNVQGVQR